MDKIIREFGELIDDDVLLVAFQLGALVVYFLDIALGARRAHDVGWISDPAPEPVEPLAAHAGRPHRRAPAARGRSDGPPPHPRSQSNRSRLMPAGNTAVPRQPRMREIATPPRQ